MLDLNQIDSDGINRQFDKQQLPDEEIQAIVERMKADLDMLITKAGIHQGRMMFEDIVDSLCIEHYNFTFLHDTLKVMKKAVFERGVCYQPLNEGKALLISPIGWKVMEQSIVKNKPTLIVMRETTPQERDEEHEARG